MFGGMATPTRRSPRPPLGLAVLLALAVVAAFAGTSRASCGDWIVGHGIESAARAHAPRAAVSDWSPDVAPASPLRDVPICDGPACRTTPLPPSLPTEAIVTGAASDPALVVPSTIPPPRPRCRCSVIGADVPASSIPRAVPTPPPKAAGLS